MSRNYELLQELHAIWPGTAAAAAPAPARIAEVETLTLVAPEWRNGHSELARLLQRIFAESSAPRVVAFAGIASASDWISAHSAEILSFHSRRTVCVVDANLYRPVLQDYFGLAGGEGLTDALCAEDPITNFIRLHERTAVITAGVPPKEWRSPLHSPALPTRIGELRQQFDYVLIQLPPLDICPESRSVAELADGVILVMEASSTRRDAALKAKSELLAANVHILGAVLDNYSSPLPLSLRSRLLRA